MTTAQGQNLAAAIALVIDRYGYHRLAAMIPLQYRAGGKTDEEFFVKVVEWIRRIPDNEAIEGLDFVSVTLVTALTAVAKGANPAKVYEAATLTVREVANSDADPLKEDSTFRRYP
jgi:hypothetical protein